jgi:hypothetical protein
MIEAGSAFRALAARLPAIELTGNRRQVAQWERETLALLRDGDSARSGASMNSPGAARLSATL